MSRYFEDVFGWEERTKAMNSKRINDIIDSLPVCADGKQKVRELVKELKPEYEDQPEVKAGQVWVSSIGNIRLVVRDQNSNENLKVMIMEDGFHTVLAGRPSDYLDPGYKLVANSVSEYVAKKQRGEV